MADAGRLYEFGGQAEALSSSRHTGQAITSHVMQVIMASGMVEQELDSDLQERLVEAEHQQETDASLNNVLVLAARAEIDQLRNVITSSAQVVALGTL